MPMRVTLLLSLPMLTLLAGQAAAACAPLRFGYTDQAVPPYYLGTGPNEAKPAAGALAELTRDAAASAGCETVMVRMPPPRLRMSMEAGKIDATSLFSPDVVGASPQIVYPLDKHGKPDPTRGMALYSVVFVRTADGLPKNGDPAVVMRGRIIGLSHGAPHIKVLRERGVQVDQGAANPDTNFEKLRRRRIDGFAVSLASQDDMDATVAARYGKEFTRLDKPLFTSTAWLALSKTYYDQNPKQAEAIWQWYGTHGPARLGALLKKYGQ
ncbi:hypothetical protein [Janthinobacterium sp. HH01]|uniref:hypothetical protein n=1 Tax=Janthinobacterium sp. HH01 TaxID=1198452 RepID=UPI0003475F63|nr:hypothetical protein [Janthinobacterium sp. HH01]